MRKSGSKADVKSIFFLNNMLDSSSKGGVLDAVRREFLKYKVISFDVFDTLLMRPYLSPLDMFQYIEDVYGCQGYAEARQKAEHNAIKSRGGWNYETNIDEIYDNMSCTFREIKDVELALEVRTLSADPMGLSMYKLAIELKKKICIVSDTYLPEEMLVRVLENNGMKYFDGVFVSSTWNKTKRSGELFFVAGENMGVPAEAGVHIGDSFSSDGEQAIAAGWGAIQVERFVDRSWKENREGRIRDFVQKADLSASVNREVSLLAALATRVPSSNDFWFRFGFTFAGPLAFSFAEWVAKQASQQGVRDVYLVARDGFWPYNIIREHFGWLNAHYILLNRRIIKKLSENDGLANDFLEATFSDDQRRSRFLIVDVGTANFSAQRFLTSHGLDCYGVYWATPEIIPSNIACSVYFSRGGVDYHPLMDTGLIEFFLTEPKPSVCGVAVENGVIRPLHEPPSPQEEVRMEAVKGIGLGILAYSRMVKAVMGEYPVNISSKSIVLWNNIWLKKPKIVEIRRMWEIFHADDDNHTKYRRQFKFRHASLYGRVFVIYLKFVEKMRNVLNRI